MNKQEKLSEFGKFGLFCITPKTSLFDEQMYFKKHAEQVQFISNLIDEAEAEKKDYVIEILNKLSNIITFVEQKTEIDQGINIGLMGVIFAIEDIKKEIKECK